MDIDRAEWENKRRYLAHVLMQHPKDKRDFSEHRESILLRTSGGGVPTAFKRDPSGSGNPTQSKALDLATNPYLLHIQQCVEAVESVYDRLPPEHQGLAEEFYWSGKYDPASDRSSATRFLARNPDFPRSSFYRWNREVIVALGVELGMFNLPLS